MTVSDVATAAELLYYTPIMNKDAWVRRQHLSRDNPSGD